MKGLLTICLLVAAPLAAQERPQTVDNPLYAILGEVTSVLAQARVPFTPEQEGAMTLLMEDRRQASEQLFEGLVGFSARQRAVDGAEPAVGGAACR